MNPTIAAAEHILMGVFVVVFMAVIAAGIGGRIMVMGWFDVKDYLKRRRLQHDAVTLDEDEKDKK